MKKQYLSLRLIFILFLSFLFVQNSYGAKETDKEFVVIIDAGHGGKDIGATDNGVMEKNINLNVAKQIESLLKKKKGIKVVMTRNDDSYLTLQQRADKANKVHGDLFVSIHTNSVDKKRKDRKSLSGSSVYTLGLHKDDSNLQVAMRENSVIELENNYEKKYSGFDPQKDESYIIFEMAQKKNLSQSIRFAESLEKELVNSGRENRGVHQAGFWVLWATSMPSVLVELDFICNPESAKYMASNKGVKELASAISKAIEQYGKQASLSKMTQNNKADNNHVQQKESSEKMLGADDENVSAEKVVIAQTRTKKTAAPQSAYTRTNNNQRKRRSAAGKLVAMNADYETNSIISKKSVGNININQIRENKTIISEVIKYDSPSKIKNKNKKVKKEKTKEKILSGKGKINKLVTVYKIQILASKDLLKEGNSRFCGLTPVSTYKENNLYKYFYGESTDQNEMETLLSDVRKKIPDAFIVTSTKSIQSK